MKKKISSIFLAAFMLCSVMFGCTPKDSGNDSSAGQNNSTTSEEVGGGDKQYVDVTDGEQHLVDDSKRLHRNNNDYTKMLPFVVDGKSDYVIIDGAASDLSKKAVDHMKKQIGYATNYYPDVYYDADHNKKIDNNDPTAVDAPLPAKKYIVLSHPVLEAVFGTIALTLITVVI